MSDIILRTHAGSKRDIIIFGVVSLLFLMYGYTEQKIYINFSLIIIVVYIFLSNAEQILSIVAYLLPMLGIFMNDTGTYSYATLILVLAFIKHIVNRFNNINLNRYGLALTFLVVLYESLHIVMYDVDVFMKLIRWVILFIYASMLVIDVKFKPNIERVVNHLFVGLLLSAVIGLLIGTSNATAVSGIYIDRLQGAIGDPNAYSMLTLITAMCFINFYKNRHRGGLFYVIGSCILILLGLLTLSRAYLISLTVVSLIFLVYMILRKDGRFRKYFLSIFIISVTSIILFNKNLLSVMYAIIGRIQHSENLVELTNGRILIIDSYLSGLLSSINTFVFGVGMQDYMSKYEVYSGPHNTIIEALVAWGIIGTVLFSLYITSLYKCEQLKSHNKKPTIISLLPAIGMFVFLLSVQSLAKYSTYFYLAIILKNAFYTQSIYVNSKATTTPD